jgi:hypothetical protein
MQSAISSRRLYRTTYNLHCLFSTTRKPNHKNKNREKKRLGLRIPSISDIFIGYHDRSAYLSTDNKHKLRFGKLPTLYLSPGMNMNSWRLGNSHEENIWTEEEGTLFICGLFNDAISSSYDKASTTGMIRKCKILNLLHFLYEYSMFFLVMS